MNVAADMFSSLRGDRIHARNAGFEPVVTGNEAPNDISEHRSPCAGYRMRIIFVLHRGRQI